MPPVVETNEQSEHLIRTKQLNAGVGVHHILFGLHVMD